MDFEQTVCVASGFDLGDWGTVIVGIGGLFTTLVVAWFGFRIQSRSKRAQYLENQLKNLYGPLHFYCRRTQVLFNLAGSTLDAHKEHFEPGDKWSQNEQTQKSVSSDSHATIDLSNKYVAIVRDTYDELQDLVRDNFAWVELEDIKLVEEVMEDIYRLTHETDSDVSWSVRRLMGSNISYLRPEFIQRIGERFTQKQAELARLQK